MTTQRNTAIVTGAASGIGRAMTLGLLSAGIDVAAVDREAPWLDQLKSAVAVSGLSGQLQTLQSDLSDSASFDRIVAAVLGAAGRIDILVNNAGIGQGSIRADQRRNPLRFWDIREAFRA
jgi:NAD(P)-dependent dehydrogenase (short-subunit alcohol dehydrogenase family)